MDNREEKLMFNMDDKDLVIMAVTVIAIVSLFVLADPTTIIASVLSGLFGLATGRRLDNK